MLGRVLGDGRAQTGQYGADLAGGDHATLAARLAHRVDQLATVFVEHMDVARCSG